METGNVERRTGQVLARRDADERRRDREERVDRRKARKRAMAGTPMTVAYRALLIDD